MPFLNVICIGLSWGYGTGGLYALGAIKSKNNKTINEINSFLISICTTYGMGVASILAYPLNPHISIK